MIVASAVSINVKPRRCDERRTLTVRMGAQVIIMMYFLNRDSLRPASNYTFPYETIELILKIGRMIAMAMKPTMPPMTTIMMGSIMLVTALIASRSARA